MNKKFGSILIGINHKNQWDVLKQEGELSLKNFDYPRYMPIGLNMYDPSFQPTIKIIGNGSGNMAISLSIHFDNAPITCVYITETQEFQSIVSGELSLSMIFHHYFDLNIDTLNYIFKNKTQISWKNKVISNITFFLLNSSMDREKVKYIKLCPNYSFMELFNSLWEKIHYKNRQSIECIYPSPLHTSKNYLKINTINAYILGYSKPESNYIIKENNGNLIIIPDNIFGKLFNVF